jgi:predicted DNA-binding protein YlxM (UPF0122 family)
MPRGAPKRTTLTPLQKKALGLYLKGLTIRRIAEACAVTPQTVFDWRNKSEPFREALKAALEDVDWSNSADIRHLVRTSYDELEGLLQDPNPGIRLGACRLTLEAYTRMVAMAEDKAALAQLESRLEQLQAQAQLTTSSGSLAPAEEPVLEAEVVEVAPDLALDPEPEAKKPRRRKASRS